MKKISLLLVIFLVFLYMVPVNVSATEWGTSEQSITSFAEETGWIHDCSNTTGITNTTSGDTVTSDGNIITLTSDGDGGSYEMTAVITTTDYPFLVLNCTSISSGDGWKLEQYNGVTFTWHILQTDYATDTAIYRYNMLSLDGGITKFRINVTQTATIKFDFFYAYTIANFTVTQSASCNTGDYAFVDSSGLNIVKSTEYYLSFDHDPALSVAVATFDLWNITMFWTDTEIIDFRFKPTVGGVKDWTTHTDETQGTYTGTGTLTDIELTMYTSMIISQVKFMYVLPEWHEVGEATLIFEVPFDYWALNMALIFGGLIIMLLSVCLMAKKVRDRTITRDAGILLLFLFFVGWGLFIGGALL